MYQYSYYFIIHPDGLKRDQAFSNDLGVTARIKSIQLVEEFQHCPLNLSFSATVAVVPETRNQIEGVGVSFTLWGYRFNSTENISILLPFPLCDIRIPPSPH